MTDEDDALPVVGDPVAHGGDADYLILDATKSGVPQDLLRVSALFRHKKINFKQSGLGPGSIKITKRKCNMGKTFLLESRHQPPAS